MTASPTIPLATIWVCIDCLCTREGEAPETTEREPWGNLPTDEVTCGLLDEEHACQREPHPDGSRECDCEKVDFSTRDCDACGSHYAGERHAYTLWGDPDTTGVPLSADMLESTPARLPTITGREQVRIGRVYAQRFGRDTALPRAEYSARLYSIRAELYPTKRYPGEK